MFEWSEDGLHDGCFGMVTTWYMNPPYRFCPKCNCSTAKGDMILTVEEAKRLREENLV